MKKKHSILFLAIGLLASGVARADVAPEERATTMTYTAGEYVVTASRFEELKKDLTSNVTVISRDEIEESPAEDLGELLAEKSVGHIQKYPGAMTSIGIRSFRSDTHGNDLRGKILILLNGRRAGTGNLAKIMTENVERIEIIRGAAAVQYGSAAIGGVVNVITRTGEGIPSFFVEHTQGSHEFREIATGFSGSSGKFDFSGGVNFSDAGDYETAGGQTYFNTGYDDRAAGSFNIGYQFMEHHHLGVIYNHFEVGRQGSPSTLEFNDLTAYNELANHAIDFIYDGTTADGSVSWMGRYYNGEDEYVRPLDSFYRIVDQEGAQVQASALLGDMTLTAGLDWLAYDESSSNSPRLSEYTNTAAFALLKYRFLDDQAVMTAGLRYDDYDVEIKNEEGFSASADNLTKSLGLAYNVSSGLKVRGSYSEGFRMPAPDELAADYSVDYGSWGSFTYLGNDDLEPESSNTYEFGADYSRNGIVAGLTYFTTDFKDKIQTVGRADYDTWVNLGGATIAGFEGNVSVDVPVDAGWVMTPYASFTFLTEYDDDESDELLTYTPESNISAGLRMADGHGLSGVVNLSYMGETMIERPLREKGGFAVVNMSLARKFLVDRANGRGVTIKGSVNNMFDRGYEYVAGYPMPGRSFTLGLRVDI